MKHTHLLTSIFLVAVSFSLLQLISPKLEAAVCAPLECDGGEWHDGFWYDWQVCGWVAGQPVTCCLGRDGNYKCPEQDCKDRGCCWGTAPSSGSMCTLKQPTGTCTANWCQWMEHADCYSCTGVGPVPSCTDSSPAAPVLVSPATGTQLINQQTVTLTWNAVTSWGENCDDPELNNYHVYVGIDGAPPSKVADLSSATSYVYALDTSADRTYSWYVTSDNGAATGTSGTFIFTNLTKMELTVTVQETSRSTTSCLGTPVRALAGVSVYEPTTNLNYTTDVNGQFKVTLSYSPVATIQLCPSYSEGMCQAYSIKCADSAKYDSPQNCVTIPQTTVATTQSTTLQLSKIKKDPWVAVVDGDAYAKNFTNPGPCSSETQVLGGFYGGMLNLNKLSLGSNIYALSVSNSPFPGDISEGTGGGYAKNIGVAEYEDEEIVIPEHAKTMTNLGGYIRPDVYKMSVTDFNNSSGLFYFLSSGNVEVPNAGTTYDTRAGLKCYPEDRGYWEGLPGNCSTNIKLVRLLGCTPSYCYYLNGNISPRVAYVYVAGNPSDTLIIDSPIKGIAAAGISTAPGTVVIITKARVRIDPSLATPLATYTVDSPPQIEAVIISSNVLEVGSNYTEATPDNPVVFYGSLISTKPGASPGKGVQILRDLGLNNNTYPSVVVNYPLGMLDRVNKSIKFNSKWGIETGFEVFDVKYEFDDVGETGN